MDDIEQPSEDLELPEITPEEPSPEPSKFDLFLRKLLRWGTGVLAIFALGIILTWIVQVNPRVKKLRDLEDQFESANQKIDKLDGELDTLRGADVELEETRLHLSVLSILVDVSSAQLSLNDGNIETAQAALAETDSKLELLAVNLGTDQRETLESLRERLSLAISEIEEDVFAAQSDLEVLRNSILALERSLFGS